MGKSIITILIFLSLKLYAQDYNNLGIKFGITNSNSKLKEEISEYPQLKNKQGINFALLYERYISKNISIYPNIKYSEKGFKENPYTISINTLSLQILGKYNIKTNEIIPYISFGPRIDYIYSIKSDYYYNPAAEYIIYWDKTSFKNFNLGITANVGVEYLLDNKNIIFLELEYNHDFSNVLRYNFSIQGLYCKSFDICIGIKS